MPGATGVAAVVDVHPAGTDIPGAPSSPADADPFARIDALCPPVPA